MRTRCPACATDFKITAEQLRAKAGKVRCGNCQGVFNAFDTLVEEGIAAPAPVIHAPSELAPQPLTRPQSEPEIPSASATTPPAALLAELPSELPTEWPADFSDALESAPPADSVFESPAEIATPVDTGPSEIREEIPRTLIEETPEESARAAREAGLMAARDLSETASYDRWSAGTLVLDARGHIVAGESGGRLLWPFVVVATLLALLLGAQLAHHFRTELVQSLPSLRGVFVQLGSDVPLPRQSEWVSIETSDLQADAARGLLVLHATLKNRASYAQEWPALELSLTDAEDSVVTRRVLKAADYLPAKADARAFAGSNEIGLRLWIESKNPAAGYRLYVFYP